MSSLVLSSVVLKDHVSLPAYLHAEEIEEKDRVAVVRKRNGFCLEEARQEEEQDSSESSSIGADSSSSSSSSEKDGGGGGGEEEEEVESKKREGAFGCLDSLEESLPIKRGLSNFFSGKSKSFASLSDAANANADDLAKPENPFNKRRRILLAYKARRASYGSLICASTYLPPLLSPDHTVDEGDEEEEERSDLASLPPLPSHGNNDHKKMITNKAFRSPRSFSLSNLQHA